MIENQIKNLSDVLSSPELRAMMQNPKADLISFKGPNFKVNADGYVNRRPDEFPPIKSGVILKRDNYRTQFDWVVFEGDLNETLLFDVMDQAEPSLTSLLVDSERVNHSVITLHCGKIVFWQGDIIISDVTDWDKFQTEFAHFDKLFEV